MREYRSFGGRHRICDSVKLGELLRVGLGSDNVVHESLEEIILQSCD